MLGWALAFRSIIGVLLTVLMLVPLVGRMEARRLFAGSFWRAIWLVLPKDVAIDSGTVLTAANVFHSRRSGGRRAQEAHTKLAKTTGATIDGRPSPTDKCDTVAPM
jgi:hypothetical protein